MGDEAHIRLVNTHPKGNRRANDQRRPLSEISLASNAASPAADPRDTQRATSLGCQPRRSLLDGLT